LFILCSNICDSRLEVLRLSEWMELFNLGYTFFWITMVAMSVFIVGAVAWFKMST